MPQEIYNEGRVVGLSAWELFKRQALGNGVPENVIPDEHQWITSMIGAGASMILNIPAKNEAGWYEFTLPEGSSLSAAGTILASPFIGECTWSGNWATKVVSYGPLIANNSSSAPSTDGADVPPENPITYTDTLKNAVAEFVKITDGIVYTKNAGWIPRAVNDSQTMRGDGTKTQFVFGTEDAPQTVISITKVIIYDAESGDPTEIAPDQYTLSSDKHSIIFTGITPGENDAIAVDYYRVADADPQKDINPEFNKSTTVVRLYLSAKTNNPINVMLTGFTNKRILQGVSGYADTNPSGYNAGGSTDVENNDWVNGGMLGPEIFPWSCKIVFCVPSFAYNLANSIVRTLPKDIVLNADQDFGGIKVKKNISNGEIRPNSIIDFNGINLTDYYDQNGLSSVIIQEDVPSVILGTHDTINELVAWYPGMTKSQLDAELAKDPKSKENFFAPVLYAAQITGSGEQKLVPIDVAAPGTVKGFNNPTQAINYQALMPQNVTLYRDQNNMISFVIPNVNDPRLWPGAAKIEYLSTAPLAKLTSGQNSAEFIALTNANGVEYNFSGSAGISPIGPQNNLKWVDLLSALSAEREIDILGTDLHNIGTEMQQTNTIGITNHISQIGADSLALTKNTGGTQSVEVYATADTSGSTKVAKLAEGTTLKAGTDFIEFSNGLRLYISETEPTAQDVPVGSIGIGWVSDATDTNTDAVVVEDPPIEDSDSSPAMGG